MGRKKLTLEEVENICKSFGWTLLSVDYVNVSTNLEIMCDRGHISYKSVEKIKQRRGCKYCRSENQRVDYETVKRKFLELGLALLTSSYKSAHALMPVLCENGHYSNKTWNSVTKGRGCNACSYDEMSGDKNSQWNPEKTDEQRIRQRGQRGYYIWRKEVFQRDDYTCQGCGSKELLTTHHIYSYTFYPELRTVLANGITLCSSCHLEFHRVYTKYNNNQEQLDEFIINKKEELRNMKLKESIISISINDTVKSEGSEC